MGFRDIDSKLLSVLQQQFWGLPLKLILEADKTAIFLELLNIMKR